MTEHRALNVLFLCTGNSARSVLSEALTNAWGGGRLQAFSAGSQPKGQVHPMSLRVLQEAGIPTEGLRSKSWDEFAAPGAPTMDLVVTVCSQAAGEVCPIWPGAPLKVHWGLDDPAAVTGPEAEQLAAFREAYGIIAQRIEALAGLDWSREPEALNAELTRIGELGQPVS